MNLLSWNCQGLWNQRAVTILSHLVREKSPKVFFIFLFLFYGNKTINGRDVGIQANLPTRCILIVPCIQRRGGLALLGKKEVSLHIQTFSPNHIYALILNDKHHPWRLTGFYRCLKEQQKKESWQLLKHLHTRSLVPWLCCGDFNEILNSSKK